MRDSRTAVPPWRSSYVLHRALRVQLAGQIERRLGDRDGLDVVDVGCGTRPYEQLFAGRARRYVGVDLAPGEGVDVVGRGEDLPLADESFDCVLCSQVLEHSDEPNRVVAEASRVLRPGGLALLSTHGVIRYHATEDRSVDDYWRWTHAGLERLVRTAAPWSSVDVYPNGGTWSALGFLTGREIEASLAGLRVGALASPLVAMINLVTWNADRALRRRFANRPPDLAPNYLVAAVR